VTEVTDIDDRDSRLAALLDELAEAAQRGESPQLEELARQHPDLGHGTAGIVGDDNGRRRDRQRYQRILAAGSGA
jgi:hypothetical protein